MKISIILYSFVILILSSGCSQKVYTSNSKIDDDYVLIEFAAKLEDDYHRIEKHPIEINKIINNTHP